MEKDFTFTGYVLIEKDGKETVLGKSPFETPPNLTDTMKIYYKEGKPLYAIWPHSSGFKKVEAPHPHITDGNDVTFRVSDYAFRISIPELKRVAFMGAGMLSEKLKEILERTHEIEREKISVASSILVRE